MRSLAALIPFLVLAGCGDGTTVDAGVLDAGAGMDAGAGIDAGDDAATAGDAGTDASAVDAGSSADAAGELDAGLVDAGGDAGAAGAADAAVTDAGPACSGRTLGSCDDSVLSCLGCPAGGPLTNYLCTTSCTSDAECTDPARPVCNRPTMGLGGMGICADSSFICRWGAICASPDTPIATPFGERAIADIAVGDLVYTMHEGALVARPVQRVAQTAVVDHAVVRAVLSTGRFLEISGRHPTADGRLFRDLIAGGTLDGTTVDRVEMTPYMHAFTHDILPDSDTGTYVAGGVLIGTTLTP